MLSYVEQAVDFPSQRDGEKKKKAKKKYTRHRKQRKIFIFYTSPTFFVLCIYFIKQQGRLKEKFRHVYPPKIIYIQKDTKTS